METIDTSISELEPRRHDLGGVDPGPSPSASKPTVSVGRTPIGPGHPVFVIAEIGINHNGSLEVCEKLIEGAVQAGCDAVKFQKRTPELCVPLDQWNVMRDTPWGRLPYIEYKRKIELGLEEFTHIDRVCKQLGVLWFASAWDLPSIEFMERFEPPCYKAASASLTDHALLAAMKRTNRPLFLSTGMSTREEIQAAVRSVGQKDLMIAHATSTYPCPVEELNLRMISTLERQYPACPIGYSGHETGLAPTWAAVALGATFVERHITLDRAMWGTDHAASVELSGLVRLVSQIRDIERAVGDGVKRVYASEEAIKKKLRRTDLSADRGLPSPHESAVL
jgi:N-acetylneuraminate synthase